MKKQKLTPHSNALALVLKNVRAIKTVKVKLKNAAALVLRQGLKADRNIPPFNRSAMDGYAVKSVDIKNGSARLVCVGVLEAGEEWKRKIKRGECLKIMTGAPVPLSADAVIKVEQSRADGKNVELKEPSIAPYLNIHRMGADAKKGELLMEQGVDLTARNMAVAATVGAVDLKVSETIKVTVITTGSEVIDPSKKPKPSQIRDCNSSHLIGRLHAFKWIKPKFAGIVKDSRDKFKSAVKKAISSSNVVLVTGGVSMGDFDYTHKVLAELKVRNIFHKAAIRPGKPVWFGLTGNTLVFGLPGNPVSVAVTFNEFVLPALRKMAGFANPLPRSLILPLSKKVKKKHQLKEFRIARFEKGGAAVAPVTGYAGSGDFISASRSDGLIVLPEDRKELDAGEPVEFHPWDLT